MLIVASAGAMGYYVWSQFRKSPKAVHHGRPVTAPAAAKRTGKTGPGMQRNPFRATSVRMGPDACSAVQELAKSRFLVDKEEIPILPLAACDAAECTCIYVKHSDRRQVRASRRALGRGVRNKEQGEERRSGKDRRGEEEGY